MSAEQPPPSSPSSPSAASQVKLALSTVLAGARLARKAGLVGAVSPAGLARFALDVARHGRRGGAASIVHLHALGDARRPAIVSVSAGGGPAGGGDPTVRLDYGQLDARVVRLANGLHRLGVVPGDRVAVLLRNGHEHLEVGAALAWLGALAVEVGYRLKPPEVAYVLRNSNARALVLGGEHVSTVEVALAELGSDAVPRARCVVAGGAPPLGFVDYESLTEHGDASRPPAVKVQSYGTMVYTSGTTGKPKGATRDLSKSHFETVIQFMSELPIHRDERHLVVCPLYHSAAQAFVALTVALGGCLVVMEHFDPALALRVIERERITSTMMVPTMYRRLLELGPEVLGRHDLSSLRWLMSGAAPLPTELARRIEAAFGPILYNFYGATETGFVTLARPGEHTARPGTIGRLVPGNEVRLLDERGRDVPEGAVGELYVRSRMLMQGYHGNEAATRGATRDGFISVGDLARRDGDGFYYLAERKSDMVISGGVNIYPLEIEQRLHEHPAVGQAAVVGVPDAEWGESLVAFVVRRAGHDVSEAELRAHVGAALADYKRPRRVFFVDELPHTATGKVLKRALREEAVARLAGGSSGVPA